MKLGQQQGHREHQQGDPGPADRQCAQGGEAEQQADGPRDPWEEGPWVIQLHDQAQGPDSQEQVGDVRLRDEVEEALDEAHRHIPDVCVVQLEHGLARRCGHSAAAGLGEQVVQAVGDDLDDAFLFRFVGRDGDTLAHRGFGPGHVSLAVAGDAAGEGRGVLGHFGHHGLVALASAKADGVGRADVSARGHRS